MGYVSAPVLGRPDVAAKGELNILAGGAPEALERVHPIFEVIGTRVLGHGQHRADGQCGQDRLQHDDHHGDRGDGPKRWC